jgi:hypothetical protein
MSMSTFGAPPPRMGPGPGGVQRQPAPNPAQIQKILDENAHLIQTIQDYQSKGKGQDCLQYQQTLHRNLVYLASLADGNQNIQQMLPVSEMGLSLYVM